MNQRDTRGRLLQMLDAHAAAKIQESVPNSVQAHIRRAVDV